MDEILFPFQQRALSDPCLKPFHFCPGFFFPSSSPTLLKSQGNHSLLGLALQPPCQLSGEKDIGQLAVTVGEATIVALLAIEVMEADSASVMSQ